MLNGNTRTSKLKHIDTQGTVHSGEEKRKVAYGYAKKGVAISQ
jgi:hypothetical protein